ncbi:MAG: hypothetical protein NXI15_16050 [Gammaproteobacteria bacterium]|nr:hypothetical protein [Gammaproteobacteria bacterium]
MKAVIRSALLVVFAVLGTGSLVACSAFDEKFYEAQPDTVKPSEDPLVLAYFERALNDEGIAYKRNYEGKYMALHPNQNDDLIDVSKRFDGFSVEQSTLKVTKGCAAQRMQAYLRSKNIIYTVVLQQQDAYLHMSLDDFNKYDIAGQWDAFTRGCAASE